MIIKNRISVALPAFSMFIYMINWMLVVTIFFSILYAANKDVDNENTNSQFDKEELDGIMES